jgi:predicted dehydrogenase
MIETLRFGIIGIGWAGERHVRAISMMDRLAVLVVVADDRSGVAEMKAREQFTF